MLGVERLSQSHPHLREQSGITFLMCISMRSFSVSNSTMVTWSDYLFKLICLRLWSLPCRIISIRFQAQFGSKSLEVKWSSLDSGQVLCLRQWSHLLLHKGRLVLNSCQYLAFLLDILEGYIWNRNFSVHICIYKSSDFYSPCELWKWGGRVCPWTSALNSSFKHESGNWGF